MRPDQVRIFYPFSFRLTSDFRMADVPERLTQILSEASDGARLEEVFTFRRPKRAPTWDQVRLSSNDSYELVGITKPVRLRGAFIMADEAAAWFIASPVLDDLAQLAALGFRVDDFRAFDATLDTLILQQSNRMAIRDADTLVNEIRELRDDHQRILDNLDKENLKNLDSDSQGTVMSSMMHDVMSPLAMATAASQLVEDTLERLRDVLISGSLNLAHVLSMLDEAGEMNRHVRMGMIRSSELMRLVKQISIDQSSLREREVHAVPYLKDLVQLFGPLTRKHRVLVEVDGDGTILFHHPGRIARIIANLVENSVVHGFAGRSSGTIRITLEREGGEIVLTYQDDGVGMDADTLSRHMDAYFTTRAESGGSGLGTFAIHTIVTTQFGGTIQVQSEPGKGTCYDIRFPG